MAHKPAVLTQVKTASFSSSRKLPRHGIQHLATRFRQQQRRDDHQQIPRPCDHTYRFNQRHSLRKHANKNREKRAEPAPEVVAKPLPRAAYGIRIQLR
jgi:hypothetical protein